MKHFRIALTKRQAAEVRRQFDLHAKPGDALMGVEPIAAIGDLKITVLPKRIGEKVIALLKKEGVYYNNEP